MFASAPGLLSGLAKESVAAFYFEKKDDSALFPLVHLEVFHKMDLLKGSHNKQLNGR